MSSKHPPFHIYLVEIAYNGTFFQGWQWQGGEQNREHKSIHGELKKRLAPFSHTLMGQSRTDGQVSARRFFIRLKIENPPPLTELIAFLSARSDDSITFVRLTDFPHKFDLIGGMTSKTYRYWWGHLEQEELPFWILPWNEQMNEEKLLQGVQALCNFTDFYHFQEQHVAPEKTKRQVIIHYHQHQKGIYSLSLTAPGFMRGMCRYIVGFLFNVATERFSLEAFLASSFEEKKNYPRFKVPGRGLVLESTEYQDLHEASWSYIPHSSFWQTTYDTYLY
jgi:tRNA pseudouridine(38-40) synthase